MIAEPIAEASFKVAKAFRYWRALSDSNPTMDESELAWRLLTAADEAYREALKPFSRGGPCEGCNIDEEAIRGTAHEHPEGVHP